MAIDKSLSQYQQNLLRGTTLGALRRAGITDAPIQQAVNYPTPKIAVQAPKVQNISLPESQASMPAAGVKAASPITNLLGQNPKGAGLGSFDSRKYSDLAKSFYDKATEKKDSYLDKHVSDFLDRFKDQSGGGGGQEYSNYMTSSLAPLATMGVDFAQNFSGTTPLAPLALSLPSEGEGSSYSDTQIQNMYESGDSDTKNSITKLIDDGTKVINDNPYLTDILKTGAQWQAQKTVGGVLAKELGFAGVGAAGGLPGMALGWLVGKAFDFFTGNKGKDADKLPENVFGLPLTDTGSEEDKKVTTLSGEKVDLGSDEYVEDMKARDEAFEETGDYDVYSDTPTTGPDYGPVTTGTVFDAEDEEDYSTPAPAPTPVYTPPSPVRDSGGDSGGGGGSSSSDQGETSSDSGFSDSGGWADDGYWSKGGRVTKALGGRMDKALIGGRRDI